MKVELLHSTNCNNVDLSLEHISFTFMITDVSRALLQELARTRTGSLTVKSSRYTLTKDLKNEDSFINKQYNSSKSKIIFDFKRANKYILLTNYDLIVDVSRVKQLEILRELVLTGKSDDIIKYSIPECYYTKLVLTIGYYDLIHLCNLRLHKSALLEYRLLMKEIIKVIPDGLKDTFSDIDTRLTKDIEKLV